MDNLCMRRGDTMSRWPDDHFMQQVVVEGECFVWTGRLTDKGYGSVNIGGVRRAHRVAWVRANGPIPKGMCVLHTCDNRRCVRTDHLFLGTRADNNADMRAKGRQERGAGHHAAKAPDEVVAEARRLYWSGAGGYEAVGQILGVSPWTVRSWIAQGNRA